MYNTFCKTEFLGIHPSIFSKNDGYKEQKVKEELKYFSSSRTLRLLKMRIKKMIDEKGSFRSIFLMNMNILNPINMITTVLVPNKPIPYASVETVQFLKKAIQIVEFYDPYLQDSSRLEEFAGTVLNNTMNRFPDLEFERKMEKNHQSNIITVKVKIDTVPDSKEKRKDITDIKKFTMEVLQNYVNEVRKIERSDLKEIKKHEDLLKGHLKCLWREGIATTSLKKLSGVKKTRDIFNLMFEFNEDWK